MFSLDSSLRVTLPAMHSPGKNLLVPLSDLQWGWRVGRGWGTTQDTNLTFLRNASETPWLAGSCHA